jgi:hypothetical protein
MTTTAAATASQNPPRKGLHIALWVAQLLLALAFLGAGGMKLLTPIEELAKGPNSEWVAQMPALVRFIGLSEFLGALGMLLPAATRIKPGLTALAGVGLAVVMILAVGFHLMRGEVPHILPNIVLGGLATFVAYGRHKLAPIAPRG